jgi:hypothetical protein
MHLAEEDYAVCSERVDEGGGWIAHDLRRLGCR